MDQYKELNYCLDIIELIRQKNKNLELAFNYQAVFYDYFYDILDKVWYLVCELTGSGEEDRDNVCDMLFNFEKELMTRERFFDEFKEIVKARGK